MGERRKYQAHNENCLQCCLCYLLNQDPKDIINVAQLDYDQQERWFNYINGFLRGSYGKELVQLEDGVMPKVEGIAILEDMKTGVHSLVIDKDDMVLWDPNPEQPIYNETIVRMELVDWNNPKG